MTYIFHQKDGILVQQTGINNMSNYIIIGAQWGDEGKGKISNLLSEDVDMVVRYQGGANAGHTIVTNGKKIVLHSIPSGILTNNCKNIIANGCVIEIESLAAEIENLKNERIDVSPENLIISNRTHIVTPFHKLLDKISGAKVGTTGKGIGPCYVDKIRRTGIRMESIADNSFEQKYLEQIEYYKNEIKEHFFKDFDIKGSIEKQKKAASILKPYINDTQNLIYNASQENKNILFEGAQGTFLDIDHGTYPFVTSSNTTIGGAFCGTGVFIEFHKRIGIMKAYTTRVGNGPFPTEQNNKIGEILRQKGGEYGATTGRPRRCGWLDLYQLKSSVIANGFNYFAITKLDCLDDFDLIYAGIDRDKDGNPVYKEFNGWKSDITNIKAFEELPLNCKKYIDFIETYLKVPAGIISVGQDKNQTIIKNKYKD